MADGWPWESFQFSPDGRYLATCTDTCNLRVFDLTTGKETWDLKEIGRVLFSPDSKTMLAQPRSLDELRLYALATQKLLFEVKTPSDRGSKRGLDGAWVAALAFSPSGRVLAVAMSGGQICLLDAATGKERGRFLSMPTAEPFGRNGDEYLSATALAFSADGQWLAVGGQDGLVRIWDVHTRCELHRLHGHDEAANAIAFSLNGRRLLTFGGGEGILWDLRPRQDPAKTDSFADLLSDDGPTAYRAIWLA
jgi:WD40 repeat protein